MIRQDAWNQDEDLLLAETVLRHIREGGTQLAAFEEVAEKLSRTSAACGFRWNSSVRKKYQSAIHLAKKARKEAKKIQVNKQDKIGNLSNEVNLLKQGSTAESEEHVWFDQMISFLRKQKEKSLEENQLVDHSLMEVKKENERLREELSSLNEAYQDVREDYQVMIHALQRATKKEKMGQ
ncbi:RsfA family transcriptional regulator [Salipaludibacillus daqingensis]|uniref:RsfA family transcriptional regulator n=1 Tax=Salipaludibacillus daqingensis TaxID=3041001 RepID=UPI0024747522|nr:RsfA family transcriptional regulator [Salipaludibacillus daqingensis]